MKHSGHHPAKAYQAGRGPPTESSEFPEREQHGEVPTGVRECAGDGGGAELPPILRQPSPPQLQPAARTTGGGRGQLPPRSQRASGVVFDNSPGMKSFSLPLAYDSGNGIQLGRTKYNSELGLHEFYSGQQLLNTDTD